MITKCWKNINRLLMLSILDKVWFQKNSRIAFFSIYRSNYTRSESIQDILNDLNINFDVINHFPRSYLIRYIFSLAQLIWNIKKYDIIFVNFRWFEVLPIIWIIAKLTWKKIIFDHFISIWDTVCFDRNYIKWDSLAWRILKCYDRLLIHMSDITLLDTSAHLEFFKSELGVNEKKWAYLYVWCNEALFYPRKIEKFKKFTVFWYGNVQPIQWVLFILETAKRLEKHTNIEFILIWPIRRKLKIDTFNHTNLQIIDWINYDELPNFINKSHICIWGHFSSIWKAKRVIAWKTFQFISCWIPTILAKNTANKELFQEDWSLIHFSEVWDANMLSNIILKLSLTYFKKTIKRNDKF